MPRQQNMRPLGLDESLAARGELKQTLIAKGEATALFGQVRGEGLASALATIEQGFGEELFYPNIASRAAHLLYFVIIYRMYGMQRAHGCAGAAKNHPLADGNKRWWFIPVLMVPAPQPAPVGPAGRETYQRQYVGGVGIARGGKPARPEGLDGSLD